MSELRSYTFRDGSVADSLTDEQYREAQAYDDAHQPKPKASLSVGQSLAKFGGDILPALTGTAGTIAGTPGGPAGMFWGGATAATMGGVGREAIYNMAGIPHDQNPLWTLARLSGDFTLGGAGALGQGAPTMLTGQAGRLAPAVEKMAIGNAAPGAEEMMLKHSIPASNKGVKMAQAMAEKVMQVRQQVLDAAEKRGWGVGFKSLRSAVRSTAQKYKDADLLTTEGEAALQRAEKVLMEKVGRGPVVGQKMVPSSKGVIFGPTGQAMTSRPIYGPPAKLTPTRLEQIKEFAQKEAKSLYEARKNMKDVRPSSLEKAYEAIAAEAQAALERIPGVKKANQTYQELVMAKEAAFNAAKRSTGYRAIAAAVPLTAGAGHALVTGNPAAMMEGVLPAAAAAATLSPANLSRLAMTLNNPATMGAVGRNVGIATRLPELALRGYGVFGPRVETQEPAK